MLEVPEQSTSTFRTNAKEISLCTVQISERLLKTVSNVVHVGERERSAPNQTSKSSQRIASGLVQGADYQSVSFSRQGHDGAIIEARDEVFDVILRAQQLGRDQEINCLNDRPRAGP